MPKRPIGPGKSNQRCIHVAVRNLKLVLWFRDVYTPLRLRRADVYRNGAWSCTADRVEVLSMPRALTGSVGEGIQVSRAKSKLLEKMPELCSWLSDGVYSDGKQVGMVQLSIRPKGSVYLASLRIQDQGGMVITTEEGTIEDALLLMEAALCASPVPWSRDPYPLGQISSKKSK